MAGRLAPAIMPPCPRPARGAALTVFRPAARSPLPRPSPAFVVAVARPDGPRSSGAPTFRTPRPTSPPTFPATAPPPLEGHLLPRREDRLQRRPGRARGDGYELQEDGRLQMALLGATTAVRLRTSARVDRSFTLRVLLHPRPRHGCGGGVRAREGRRLELTVPRGRRTEKELAEAPALSMNLSRRLAAGGLVTGGARVLGVRPRHPHQRARGGRPRP